MEHNLCHFYPKKDLCQKPNTPFISFIFIRRNKYTWALAGNQYRKGIYTVGEENKKRVVEKKCTISCIESKFSPASYLCEPRVNLELIVVRELPACVFVFDLREVKMVERLILVFSKSIDYFLYRFLGPKGSTLYPLTSYIGRSQGQFWFLLRFSRRLKVSSFIKVNLIELFFCFSLATCRLVKMRNIGHFLPLVSAKKTDLVPYFSCKIQ